MTIRPYLLPLGGLAAGLICSALLFGQPPTAAPAKPAEPAFTGPRGTASDRRARPRIVNLNKVLPR